MTNTIRTKYQQAANRKKLDKLVKNLSSSRYKLEERQSILEHAELMAPLAWVVKYLKVTTIGGVVRFARWR